MNKLFNVMQSWDWHSGVLADWQIMSLCVKAAMISPFVPEQVRSDAGKKVISYGLSSGGYDVRLAPEFRMFNNLHPEAVVDPLDFDDRTLTTIEADSIVLPSGGYCLARTVETFSMPRDVVGRCLGKSTYARCCTIVNVTPLEPGWRGQLTLEIGNLSPRLVRLHAHQGIAQIMFELMSAPSRVAYGERDGGGKYQDQQGIVAAIA